MNFDQLSRSGNWETASDVWTHQTFNDIMRYLLDQLSTNRLKTTLVSKIPQVSKKQKNSSFPVGFYQFYGFRNPQTGEIWTSPKEAINMSFYQQIPNAPYILSHPFFKLIKRWNKYSFRSNKTFKFMQRYGKGNKMLKRLHEKRKQKFSKMPEHMAHSSSKMHLDQEGEELLGTSSDNTGHIEKEERPVLTDLRREAININHALFH